MRIALCISYGGYCLVWLISNTFSICRVYCDVYTLFCRGFIDIFKYILIYFMISRLFTFSCYQYLQCSLLFVSFWFILINFQVYLFLVSAIWWYQNILVQITLLWPPVWLGNCRLSVPRKAVFHSKEPGAQVIKA